MTMLRPCCDSLKQLSQVKHAPHVVICDVSHQLPPRQTADIAGFMLSYYHPSDDP